jgi:sulfate transport system ATP-binding protein
VRPHELDVLRGTNGDVGSAAGIPAQLQRVLVVGPVARLELQPAHGRTLVEAHIPAIDYQRHGFQVGETLLLRPRNARVFVGAGDGI